jgi:hypothetical protein
VPRDAQGRRHAGGGVTAGGVELGLGEEQGTAQIRPAQVGAAQVGPGEVGAPQIRPGQVGSDEGGAAQAGPAQVPAAQVPADEGGPAQVSFRWNLTPGQFARAAKQRGGIGADRIQIQGGEFTGTVMGAAGDLGGRGGQRLVHRRGRRQRLRLGQVPEQLVQRPHDREGGEHPGREGRRPPPVPSAERALDDVLPGPEAVVAGAAGEAARPELIVNGAAEAGVQVRTGVAGGLVDGEVGGRGEPRRDAAQRRTPGAVGLQLREGQSATRAVSAVGAVSVAASLPVRPWRSASQAGSG